MSKVTWRERLVQAQKTITDNVAKELYGIEPKVEDKPYDYNSASINIPAGTLVVGTRINVDSSQGQGVHIMGSGGLGQFIGGYASSSAKSIQAAQQAAINQMKANQQVWWTSQYDEAAKPEAVADWFMRTIQYIALDMDKGTVTIKFNDGSSKVMPIDDRLVKLNTSTPVMPALECESKSVAELMRELG